MISTIVQVQVKPECIEDFKEACIVNHEASIKEEGNCRFDILQNEVEPSNFVLYEAYQTKEAAALHKETDQYKKWRARVADMMAVPRVGTVYKVIRPF